MCEWAVKEVGFDGGRWLTRWNEVDAEADADRAPEDEDVVVDDDEVASGCVDDVGSCDESIMKVFGGRCPALI